MKRDRSRRAIIQARYRQNRRRGRAYWRVPIAEHDVLHALIDAEIVTEVEALDKTRTADILGQMIDEWAAQWKKFRYR
jgi:hypothetical protein